MRGIIIAALLLVGCADPIAATRNGVATVAKVHTEMVDEFKLFDHGHEMDVVAAAKTEDEGAAALTSYRKTRANVKTAARAVWLGIVAASTAADEAEVGLKNPKDLAGYISALMRNLGMLRDALTELGVPLGGL